MSIVLSPEVEQQIEELVRQGKCASTDDCIRKSVQLFHNREMRQARTREEIDQFVEEGIRDLEEGRYTDYDKAGLKAVVEQIKREGREKLGLPAD